MGVELSKRVLALIEKQELGEDVLGQTLEFVREVLGPGPERYDMLYRYEHSLRVAAVGQRIASAEGLPGVPLMMACLLHDVGYPECADLEELKCHAAVSARIAALYLRQIRYEESMSEHICRAVELHDKGMDDPAAEEILTGATPFELSVRDADDIDRFDIMRLCILGYHDIGERPAEEVIENCRRRLERAERYRGRICGTETARRIWLEEMEMHRRFYQKLMEQMEAGGAVERVLLQGS